jgi:hypothetical protein
LKLNNVDVFDDREFRIKNGVCSSVAWCYTELKENICPVLHMSVILICECDMGQTDWYVNVTWDRRTDRLIRFLQLNCKIILRNGLNVRQSLLYVHKPNMKPVVSLWPNPSILWAGPGTSDPATLWEGNRVLELGVRRPDAVACRRLSCVMTNITLLTGLEARGCREWESSCGWANSKKHEIYQKKNYTTYRSRMVAYSPSLIIP